MSKSKVKPRNELTLTELRNELHYAGLSVLAYNPRVEGKRTYCPAALLSISEPSEPNYFDNLFLFSKIPIFHRAYQIAVANQSTPQKNVPQPSPVIQKPSRLQRFISYVFGGAK